jgi:hypothetical protein
MFMQKFILSIILLSAFGCSKQPAPPPVADSATTAKAGQSIQGKKMRTFRGPADILGDTTKNARKPPMRKSEPFGKLRAGT